MAVDLVRFMEVSEVFWIMTGAEGSWTF